MHPDISNTLRHLDPLQILAVFLLYLILIRSVLNLYLSVVHQPESQGIAHPIILAMQCSLSAPYRPSDAMRKNCHVGCLPNLECGFDERPAAASVGLGLVLRRYLEDIV